MHLRPLIPIVAVGLFCGLVGCSKKKDAPPVVAPATATPVVADTTARTASGAAALFEQHCLKCHAISDTGGGGGGGPGGPGWAMKGPGLAHVGAEHDSAWIGVHIKNPKSHKPQSRMPESPAQCPLR